MTCRPPTLKNGRAARQGTCTACGTTITVMGAAKADKAYVRAVRAHTHVVYSARCGNDRQGGEGLQRIVGRHWQNPVAQSVVPPHLGIPAVHRRQYPDLTRLEA